MKKKKLLEQNNLMLRLLCEKNDINLDEVQTSDGKSIGGGGVSDPTGKG